MGQEAPETEDDDQPGYVADGTDTRVPFANLSPSQQATMALTQYNPAPVQPKRSFLNPYGDSPPSGDKTSLLDLAAKGGAQSQVGFGGTGIEKPNGQQISTVENLAGVDNSTPPAPYKNPNLDFGDPGTPQPGQQMPGYQFKIPGIGGSDQFGKQYAGGLQQQQAGVMANADVESKKAQAEQAILQSGIPDQEKYAQLAKVRADDMQQFVQTQTKKTMDMMDDFRNNSKVNPNAYWDNMGVGGKVSSGLALLLSGFGSGMSGQANMAQKVIDDGIKANIDAQVKNIQTKKDAINDQNNLVAQYMKNGMDINEAQSAAMATQRNLLSDKVKASAAGFAAPQAQANAVATSGKLQADAAKDMSGLASASQQRAGEGIRLGMEEYNQNLQMQTRGDLMRALQGGAVNAANPMLAPYMVRMSNGNYAVAPTPEMAGKAREVAEAGTARYQALLRLRQDVANGGESIPFTEAREKYKTDLDASDAATRNYYKVKGRAGGGGEGAEAEGAPSSLIEGLAGGGQTIMRDRALAHIDQLLNNHQADEAAGIQGAGGIVRRQPKRTKQEAP